jgi:hypothetical protein
MAHRSEPRLWVRLLWFAGLWLAGVAAVALVGLLIRSVLL